MEMSDTLRQIDSLKKETESLQPAKPEYESVFWEKFRLEFNYNSNHIEGNSLTYGQTKLLLLFDRITGDTKGRDIEEMKAHNVALKMITELSANAENWLTEKLIREINELILVRPFFADAITPDHQPTKRLITPGEYKKHHNSVLLPDGNMFYYASPEETPALMGDLMEWYRKESLQKEFHPVHLAALFHYRLVRIHPFDDSNGRTARLIMNYILMKNGYVPIVIESADKKNYLTALNKADIGDLETFVNYISEISLKWQQLYLKAMMGEKIEEKEDFEKQVSILKKRIAKKENVEPKKNKEVISQIYEHSFIPFINIFGAKLKQFEDFFFEKEITVTCQSFNKKINTTTALITYKDILADLLNSSNQLIVVFSHVGLIKEKKRSLSYITNIMLSCFDYDYEIQFSGLEKSIKKKNNQFLDNTEIEELSEGLSKLELNFLNKNL